jgi:aspartate aminotransferase
MHLNLNVRGLQQSATIAINERSRSLATAGREVYKLGLGQSPFPVPAPMERALQENAHQKDYLPTKGLPALTRSVARYLAHTEGLTYRAENVLVGPGTKELMFLLQLVYYGDLVLPNPSWVSYAPQAQIIGRQQRWLSTRIEDGYKVIPWSLEALCRQDPNRPRLLVINYPGNPTGVSYTAEELEAIAEVARKYHVLVLSDEIYSGLRFDGAHRSIARYYPEGTIISNGISKWCGAGGWRLGAFVFPDALDWLLEGMAALASETFTAVSAPIQYAAVQAFQGDPKIERYLWGSRRILAAIADFTWDRLRAAGAELPRPCGAFYQFPNFESLRDRLGRRGIHDGSALCERLMEDTGVATLPGVCFGRQPEELSARLALVDFNGGAALEAVNKLPREAVPDETFLRRSCPSVATAVERLCDWLRT